MSESIQSFKLTEFNLSPDEQIKIDCCGLIKIYRSQDGELVLMVDDDFGVIDPEQTIDSSVAHVDSLLAFNLDIGIRREKWLTYSNGLYLGRDMIAGQSREAIKQEHFDKVQMESMKERLDTLFHSTDQQEVADAVRLSHLLDAYNNARLLYPDFIDESYLGLMRILDALPNEGRGAIEFALYVARISPELNQQVHEKIVAIYKDGGRMDLAKKVFDDCCAKKEGKKLIINPEKFTDADKLIFSCFYSAYQYRSKFVHIGLPFSSMVKEVLDLERDSGTAYLHPAMGERLIKRYNPDGLKDGDTVDIHCIVKDEEKAKKFMEWYFPLIPTWHFVKVLVREGLKKEILNDS